MWHGIACWHASISPGPAHARPSSPTHRCMCGRATAARRTESGSWRLTPGSLVSAMLWSSPAWSSSPWPGWVWLGSTKLRPVLPCAFACAWVRHAALLARRSCCLLSTSACYAFAHAGRGARQVFSELGTNPPSLACIVAQLLAHRYHYAGRGARQVFSELGTNPLKAMMDVLLWSDAEHARMKARINGW